MRKKVTSKETKKTPIITSPPDASELSLNWLNEEQMFEQYGATKPILKSWFKLGLPSSKPTGRIFINQTDLQYFLIAYRRYVDDSGE